MYLILIHYDIQNYSKTSFPYFCVYFLIQSSWYSIIFSNIFSSTQRDHRIFNIVSRFWLKNTSIYVSKSEGDSRWKINRSLFTYYLWYEHNNWGLYFAINQSAQNESKSDWNYLFSRLDCHHWLKYNKDMWWWACVRCFVTLIRYDQWPLIPSQIKKIISYFFKFIEYSQIDWNRITEKPHTISGANGTTQKIGNHLPSEIPAICPTKKSCPISCENCWSYQHCQLSDTGYSWYNSKQNVFFFSFFFYFQIWKGLFLLYLIALHYYFHEIRKKNCKKNKIKNKWILERKKNNNKQLPRCWIYIVRHDMLSCLIIDH